MKKYTLETLKKENELFDSYYGLEDSDVKKVNRIIEMIEETRSVKAIQKYDVVEYTNEYGEYFPKATATMKKCFPQKHMINIICHIEKQKITEIINILLLKLE